MKKLYFAAILAVVVLAGCAPPDKDADAVEAEESGTLFAVNIIPAVNGQLFDYIKVSGDIKASSSVDVFPETAGKVSQVLVKIGQRVVRGQELAFVDPSRPGSTFAKSPVKAPISGTVTVLHAEVGSVSAPSIPVATISQVENLEVVTFVSERFISKVSLGQTGIIELEAYPGIRFHGTVSELSPVLDPMSRTLGVKLTINEKDSRIKAGMFAKIKLVIEEKESIVKLPSEALVTRFGLEYVFVVDGDKVEQRRITPGIRIDNKMEVIEGITSGEKVVIRGQSLLEDGASVRIVEELKPLSASDVIE